MLTVLGLLLQKRLGGILVKVGKKYVKKTFDTNTTVYTIVSISNDIVGYTTTANKDVRYINSRSFLVQTKECGATILEKKVSLA